MKEEPAKTMECGCLTGAEHRRLIFHGIPANKHLEFWAKRRK